ncbi:glycosyltransferase family 25 protein [Marinobacter sp. F4206]|uniref:glycosyltransferase family 25 protein n=1 Tax=Marinobacter sp. F4206 TaxID=2861777 RepID=UPI001C5D228F|nr:glycosyltransferase family 25 protein [Marinobacter sp. F4206]MBW4934799.1 glycosyltransferase family 25 protein [Marinobacter sp. F4206]
MINIDDAKDRWEHISRQLSEMGLVAERFAAINGRKQNHPLFERYDDSLRKKRKGDSLSLGQLGCFASHFLVWKRCMELDEPVIVLEDDVTVVVERLDEFLEVAGKLDDRIECVRLFNNKTKHHKVIPYAVFGDLAIVKYTKGPMSAMGYYLTPKGAHKLISNADKWFLAVDMYMDRFWVNDVECFGTVPACVKHDYIFDSMIGYEAKPTRSFSTRARRELFSFTENTRRFLHNLKFRTHHSGLSHPVRNERTV